MLTKTSIHVDGDRTGLDEPPNYGYYASTSAQPNNPVGCGTKRAPPTCAPIRIVETVSWSYRLRMCY